MATAGLDSVSNPNPVRAQILLLVFNVEGDNQSGAQVMQHNNICVLVTGSKIYLATASPCNLGK
jgi:hypothetical protein